jgi:hypothetical protein
MALYNSQSADAPEPGRSHERKFCVATEVIGAAGEGSVGNAAGNERLHRLAWSRRNGVRQWQVI